MISWQRMIFLGSVAVIEAAPAALLITFAGGNAWALLIGVALLAALITRLLEQRVSAAAQRLALLVSAFALGVWAMKGASGAGYGLFSGWATLFATFGSGSAFVTLLGVAYTFWRGTMLLDHDQGTITRLFGRSLFVLVVLISFGALSSTLDPDRTTLASLEMLSYFTAGLLAVALANMADGETSMRQIEWRGLLMVVATILAVAIGGLLFASLFGGFAGTLISSVFEFFLVLGLVVMSPLLLLASWLIAQLGSLIDSATLAQLAANAQARAQMMQQLQQQSPNTAAPWLLVLLQAFCLVLPVALLGLLFLLARRRGRATQIANEVRESVLSWDGLASDLRSLFASRRGEGGLRAALAALRGNDPAQRIRRSYIRLLLASEAHEHARQATQTPHEFAPSAVGAFPGTEQPVAIITAAYERARYAPETARSAEADRAEQAWRQIDLDHKK